MNFETVFYPSFEWGVGGKLEQLVSSAHFTLRPDHLSTRDIFFFSIITYRNLTLSF